MNEQGDSFHDVSALSGLDSDADGRPLALVDFDRDGWQDVILVNANSPQLEIFRNQIGERKGGHQMVGFRLIGGNKESKPSAEWSNRDAYGAMITVKAGGKSYMRELRCGEGFAAQNSSELIIGLGECKTIESAEIAWPSGRKQVLDDLQPGMTYTVQEGGQIVFEAFSKPSIREIPKSDLGIKFQLSGAPVDRPSVFVTMATWCPSCKKNNPQVALLNEKFGDQFNFIGLPVDPEDKEEDLTLYESVIRPAYKIMSSLKKESREQVSELTYNILGEEVLPSTIITDLDGNILAAQKGVPSVSALSKILQDLED